jgi:MFS family permease
VKAFARVLAFGFVSGLLWSVVAGILADLFGTPADVPATIFAGVVAGVVTSAVLALLVARFGRGLTIVLGLLSLPLGAFVFGFSLAFISRVLPALTSGTRALINPWTLGSEYALLSVVSTFAIGLFPLAVVTTLLLRVYRSREKY